MEFTLEQRTKEIKRITLWGVAVNLLLAVTKTVGGYLGQSQALIADGIHSFSDLVSDGMVLLAAKHAGEDADEDHPYGHARYETLATVALGILLTAVGIGIAYDAILRLQNPEELSIPAMFTFIIAVFSILSNEGLYHATRRVANKIRSPLLEANAWHHRSDAVSSIVVLIGLAATYVGYPVLDAVAAVIVAMMIAKIGIELSWQSLQELVDTALEPEVVEQIKQSIMDVDDVQHLHMLRSRRMGHNALVDVHIQVSPKLSVSEGHHISETVEKTLIDKFDDINDVTVHVDPEDDEMAASCKHLPLRSELLPRLNAFWSKHAIFQHIHDVKLHYLDGSITVEANVPIEQLTHINDAQSLQAEFVTMNQKIDGVGVSRLNFS